MYSRGAAAYALGEESIQGGVNGLGLDSQNGFTRESRSAINPRQRSQAGNSYSLAMLLRVCAQARKLKAWDRENQQEVGVE